MKSLKAGLVLALSGATLALVPTTSSGAVGSAPRATSDPSLVQQMRDAADGSVRVSQQRATGKVGFVAARGKGADLMPGRAGDSAQAAQAKVDAYLQRYAGAFGASSAQLTRTDTTASPYGWSLTYDQSYRGIPVFGARLKAHVDHDGDLTAIAGYVAPSLDLSVTPVTSAATAEKDAVGLVEADPPTSESGRPADTSGVKATKTHLVVYRMGVTRGVAGKAVLAYQTEVTNSSSVRDTVFVDAATGKIVNRYSMVADSLDRELYEADPDGSGYPDATRVWKEGDAFPGTLNEDQQNLVHSGGESYWLYKNTFGRDSFDGEGATMRTVNNDPTIECPNANWNGVTTNYCDGVTSDDVVSHEWGHAYTEYTSGLIYQFQPGALNESYSDVWGETIDQINDREDEGESFDAVRTVGDCDATAPAKLLIQITAPAEVAGPCNSAVQGFGPTYDTTPDAVDVVVATDATDEANGTSSTDGCGAYTNAADVAGHYAYVDRGTCSFQIKADNAVAAGATGIIVGQNSTDHPLAMGGTSPIPGVMITKADGTRIKSVGTVSMTIAAEDTSHNPATTRWLMGEKSEAFGGAIRDMWNPTCYGNPSKVSDAEYTCDPDDTDSGGVHSNSGVPNHAYALLVDGGTFNGHTVAGIGLDKAANIWWYAQSTYLTPVSDFAAAADALEQSCDDLVGQGITKLSTAENATAEAAEPITAADCDSVRSSMAAVEMRAEPTQCDFQPLLAKDTPSLCGAGFVEHEIYSEDFEDGLAGWDAEQELAALPEIDYFGGFGAPWEASTDAPGDHAGGVAYGPADDEGSCLGDGDDDFSSRDSIISPQVTLPGGTLQSPILSFDHYVATEAGYDGGNVKIKVNDGDFEVVPASAYLFNAPKTLASLAEQSTNPLAGEDGFTGTDGGKVHGSWGTSMIDLDALDVHPGDTLRIRFDIGRDGCGGIDGWYVDNVTVSDCVAGVDLTAVQKPRPSTFGKAAKIAVTTGDDTATGAITVKEGAKTLATGTLKKGRATVSLPAKLKAGSHHLKVSYAGNATHAPGTTTLTVKVAKATSKVVVTKVRPARVKRGTRASITVKVTSPTTQASGTVKLTVNGKSFGEGKLKGGKVTIRSGKLNQTGKVRVKVTYTGTGNIAGSHRTIKVKVVRR